MIVGVLAISGRSAIRINRLRQAVERVISVMGCVPERIGDGLKIALRVISVSGRLTRGPERLAQPVDQIIDISAGLRERAGRIECLLLNSVAGGIERVGNTVAYRVRNCVKRCAAS
jgi:hypothetical protein